MQAQVQKQKPFLILGPDLTYATMGVAYEAGVGGAVQLGFPVGAKSAVTITTAFQHYQGLPVHI